MTEAPTGFQRIVCITDNDLEPEESSLLMTTVGAIAPNGYEVLAYNGDWGEIAASLVPTDVLVLCGKHICEEATGRNIAITAHAGAVEKLCFGEQGEGGDDVEYTAICQLSPAYIVRQSGKKGGRSEKDIRLWTDVWEQVVRTTEGVQDEEPATVALDDEREILELLERLLARPGKIAYDYETWGDVAALRPELNRDFRIVSCGLAWREGPGPDGVKNAAFLFDRPRKASPALVRAWTALISQANAQPALVRGSKPRAGLEQPKVAHFCRYEHKCNIKRFGQTWELRDTMLEVHALDELADGGLDRVMVRSGLFWGGFKKKYSDTRKNPMEAPIDHLLRYNALDAHGTFLCDEASEIELEQEGLTHVARQDEGFSMDLAYQEMQGICVDPAEVVVQRTRVSRDVVTMLAEFRRQPPVKRVEAWAKLGIKKYHNGKTEPVFNPKSPPMMKQLVIKELKVPVQPIKKQGKEVLSLDAKVLEKFVDQYPLLQMLMDYRSREAMAVMLSKWDKYIGPTQCVHSSYNQHIVVTGRLSSTDPPLQNISKEDEVRKIFISRFTDGWLINADYAQQEPRLIAGWSQERKLIDAILAGRNLHAFVGSIIFKNSYENIMAHREDKGTPEFKQYDRGKKMNLGIAYGQTEFGLAAKTGMSIDEARALLHRYDQEFPGVAVWRLGFHRMAMEFGYVEDLFGARRHLPDARSSNKWERERALRQAGNFPVQGTAYRFTQIAAGVLRLLLAEYCPGKAFVVGQVHDSVLVDCHPDVVEIVPGLIQLAMLIHNEMPYWEDRGIPMAIDLKIGRNLYEMEKLEIAA